MLLYQQQTSIYQTYLPGPIIFTFFCLAQFFGASVFLLVLRPSSGHVFHIFFHLLFDMTSDQDSAAFGAAFLSGIGLCGTTSFRVWLPTYNTVSETFHAPWYPVWRMLSISSVRFSLQQREAGILFGKKVDHWVNKDRDYLLYAFPILFQCCKECRN